MGDQDTTELFLNTSSDNLLPPAVPHFLKLPEPPKLAPSVGNQTVKTRVYWGGGLTFKPAFSVLTAHTLPSRLFGDSLDCFL